MPHPTHTTACLLTCSPALLPPSHVQDKILEGRSITIKKGPYRGMRGRVISATATHVRLELEAQMKTVTVDRCAVGPADISYTLT